MAISEVCQFELKEEVDKLKKKNPGRSLSQCISDVIKFYASAGIQIKKTTAEAKYHRATKALANASAPITNESDNETQKNQTIKPTRGGVREGSGRKPKHHGPAPELCLVPFTPSKEQELRAEQKIRSSGIVTIEAGFIEESARRIRIAFPDDKIRKLISELQRLLKTQPEEVSNHDSTL